MSPIIYTPHECATPPTGAVTGSLWQCPDCDKVWMLEPILTTGAVINRKGWIVKADPRLDETLRVHTAPNAWSKHPTTPTVTPSMVQLVLDTYEDHMLAAPADGDGPDGPLGHCGECDTPIGPYTIQTHALEVAAAALQAEIDGGRDAEE